MEWILRVAFFGEFLGHGILAVQRKQSFIDLLANGVNMAPELASNLIFYIGIIDIIAAFVVLLYPMRILLAGGAAWAFVTALSRPMAAPAFFSNAFWDFIERFANVGVPLALLYLRGLPAHWKHWFK